MKNILDLSDAEVLKEAHQLSVAYGLKHTIRYASHRELDVHSESVAEHVFALIFLAQYFLQHEAVGSTLDSGKLCQILLFHDFGEIKYGDAVTYYKTKEHEEREKEAAKEIFASLPESLKQLGLSRWQEYAEHATPESHFAHALDKIEPMFELLDSVNERTIKHLKITVEMHLSNKIKAVKDYPVMRRFVDVITNDMNARGVFWEE